MKQRFSQFDLAPKEGEPFSRPPVFKLDVWAHCETAEFEVLTRDVRSRIQKVAPVQRWRSEREDVLRLVLCNLIQNHHRRPGRGTSYYRSPRYYSGHSAYRPDCVSGKILPSVVDALEGAGLVISLKGRWDVYGENGSVSQIVPTTTLVELWEQLGVTRATVGPRREKPTFELRSEKVREQATGTTHYSLVEPPPNGSDSAATLMLMRLRLLTINRHLDQFEIAAPQDALTISKRPRDDDWQLSEDGWLKIEDSGGRRLADLNDKHLRRIFNNVDPEAHNLDQGGRFYGPWWQSIERANRSKITIDGEPTIELDYGSFHPRMIYHRAGIDKPGDLYALPALGNGGPDIDPTKLRQAIKSLWLILINSRPKQLASALKEDREELLRRWDIELPDHLEVGDVVTLIREAHPEVADQFGTGIGSKLQFIDSQICEDILFHGARKGIPILPVHDSFIVRAKEEDEKELRSMMNEFYFVRFGYLPKIDKK